MRPTQYSERKLCLFSHSILYAILQICCITLICTWAASLGSTMWKGPSQPPSRDRLAFFPGGVAMLPPPHSLGLAWLPGLGLPQFLLLICPFQAVPMNHTYKFPYSYHIRPKLFYTYTTLWAHGTLHILYCTRLWNMVSLFVLPHSHQAGPGWPRPLMSGTIHPFSWQNRFA